MEQKKKRKPSTSKSSNDRQEIGVCGSGKHRVININPLLLTPSSALHLRNTEQSNKNKVNDSKTYGSSALRPKIPQDRGDAVNFDLSFAELPETGDASNFGNSDQSLSSSLVTLDDLNSLHESEISDFSEIGSVSGLGSSVNAGKPKNFLQNEAPLPKTNLQYNQNSKIPVDLNFGMGYAKKEKPSPRRTTKHERIIEITPSLMLPVTSIKSYDSRTPNQLGSELANDRPDLEVNKKVRNKSTVSSSSSRTSLSDSYGLKHSNADGVEVVSSYSEQDSTQVDDNSLQTECERLKQALKLADADIAILVSAKQQLQLNLHAEEEKAKSLTRNLLTANERSRNSEALVQELETSFREKEKNHEKEAEDYRVQLQKLKSESEGFQNWLDVARTERDRKKLEIDELTQNLETHVIKLGRTEQELRDVTSKNMKLEEMLQDASVKDAGTESYIGHLKEEKNNLSTKLRQKEQEESILRINNKALEARVVDLQQTNLDVSEKAAKHEARFREIDAENVTLTSRLQTATKEKMELNAAVLRLRSDLTKVEASFSRIKQQMIEKSRFAEEESFKRVELEEKAKSLALEVEKLNNVNAETRIRDKNVQIEQLLTKSKMSNLERTKLDRKIEKLQEHIDANEKSWVEAVEKEKQHERLLREKDGVIANKSDEIHKLSQQSKQEKHKAEELSSLLKDSRRNASEMKKQLEVAEKSFEKLTQENHSISSMLEHLRGQLQSEKEKSDRSAAHHESEENRFRDKIQKLSEELEDLQKVIVTKEEEVKSLKDSGGQSESKDQEEHDFHQLQLLSELQSARRTLSQEKEDLLTENKSLKLSLDSTEQEIRQINKKFETVRLNQEKIAEEIKERAETEKKKMEENIKALEKSLRESAASKLQFVEEFEVVKGHNKVLSRQLSELQIDNRRLKEDAKKNTQENKEIIAQNKITKEEMELLKQELGQVTLQLTNALQDNRNRNESQAAEVKNLTKERDLLRNAVQRQQEYAVSLQKHYEQWAREAANKMKQEVMRLKAAEKEETSQNPTQQLSTRDHENTKRERERLEEAVKSERKRVTELEAKMAGEISKVQTMAEDEKLHLMAENMKLSANIKYLNQEKKKLRAAEEKISELQAELKMLERTNEALKRQAPVFSEDRFTQTHDTVTHATCVKNTIENQLNTSDSATQTKHDKQELVSLQVAAEFTSSSTQTDHDEELYLLKKEHEDDETALLTEEKLKLIEENTNQAETIAMLEERIHNWSRTDGSVLEDVGTQTSHDDEELPAHTHSTFEMLRLLEDSSTQTDHDDEPIGNKMYEDRVLETQRASDQKVARLKEENKKLLWDISSLKRSLEAVSAQGDTISSSTQTDYDFEPVLSTTKPFSVLESRSTQTEHKETLGLGSDWQNVTEDNHKLKSELELAMNTLRNLKDSQSRMLEDAGTQTDHNDQPAVATSQTLQVLPSSLLEDSCTQTDHDDETLSAERSSTFVQLRKELASSRYEVEIMSQKVKDVTLDNVRLKSLLRENEKFVKKSKRDSGTQTIHDDDPAFCSSTVTKLNIHSVPTADASCQTEHDLQSVGSRSFKNESAQTSANLLKTSNDRVVESCVEDAQLPSPMTILKTMESKKLKAYKKTVLLLKKKRQAAEEKISELQAELKMLEPSSAQRNLNKASGGGAEAFPAQESASEINRVQNELHAVKKTAALQAEVAKRKALAERKILESKIASMSERISGLTDANAQLRNSVEVLQVKVTEKTRQGDIAIKEKRRYQTRSRRLQASLRSLAWITETQDQSTLLSEIGGENLDFSMEDSFGDGMSEASNENTNQNYSQVKPRKSREKSALSLPASVVEIEESLKDLQSEIIALEKQMQEHNTAVRKSKSHWTRLKEQSNKVFVATPQNPNQSNTDHIAQISEVI